MVASSHRMWSKIAVNFNAQVQMAMFEYPFPNGRLYGNSLRAPLKMNLWNIYSLISKDKTIFKKRLSFPTAIHLEGSSLEERLSLSSGPFIRILYPDARRQFTQEFL